MKYQIHLLLTIIAFAMLCTFVHCHEDDPCPTCFKDIVRCKVNGREWVSNCVSNDPLFGCNASSCYYYFLSGNGFDLNSTNDQNNTGLVLRKTSQTGGLLPGINFLTSIYELEFWDHSLNGNCKILVLDSEFQSILNISKIDTINYIIEGHFLGKAKNSCGDTVKITDGYFKTKFIF